MRRLVPAACALLVSATAAAQSDVVIPGMEIPGWGGVKEVRGTFVRPAGAAEKTPAVLILHGSGGVDGRGAYHAKALQEAGIATLEITMFGNRERPRAGHTATMAHAGAALKWLGGRPDIYAERIGVMGMSWGAIMSVFLSSELVQEQLGKEVPKPAAFAPLYPVCGGMGRIVAAPKSPLFGAQTRMSATPMLIQVGTQDDYEVTERSCDAFVATWPQAARERATVRYIEGATHAFDSQGRSLKFHDEFAYGGRGGMVTVMPHPVHASEARQAIVQFFLTYLKP